MSPACNKVLHASHASAHVEARVSYFHASLEVWRHAPEYMLAYVYLLLRPLSAILCCVPAARTWRGKFASPEG
jgi:hypothetical protein